MAMMAALASLFLLVTLASSARAITCYECDSVNNPGCGERFVGDDISTTDCDVAANMRSLGAEATCLTKYHEGSEYTDARRHALREALLLLFRCLPNRHQLRRWTRSCGALYELPGLRTLRYGFVQRSHWIIHSTLCHCPLGTRTACPPGYLRKRSSVERRRSYFNVSY
ncbi:uncharacterized protein Dsimw501_GD24293, isoform B [Drosophila simulans]|uniref:Uncharacterized protein, isoform B n=1 Tax=Drosophila simulans TaxID=7240 RepID=A0A0J9TSC4_DROSI|nr:uncharacterized protein Dsimw501_GD24293, isoform B [Drosophila simulans]